MAGLLKSDLINNAYSKIRISGLTVVPSPKDNALAIDALESIMEEFRGRNICVDYNFENEPDLASPHNVDKKYHKSIESILAATLCPNFGKTTDLIIRQERAAYSFLASATAKFVQTQYPSRHPIGSGNMFRAGNTNKFYQRTPEAPQSCETHKMYIDDIEIFIENYEAYLNDGETIDSYTITSDTGLTVSGDTLNTEETNITYTVEAVGSGDESSDNFLRVKIVVVTTDGRQETRFINFQLIDSEL